MKKMSMKMPAVKTGMKRAPAMPSERPVMMANGGYVKKMSSMAGNASSGTCGPGVSSRKK